MAKKIGEFLIELGILTEKQVTEIVKHAQGSGLKFGEAAIRLGILKSETPVPFPGLSSSVDFFHLDPKFFPKVTQDLFSTEQILKWGVLPLGYKTSSSFFKSTKMLNLGFLDPTNLQAVEAAKAYALEKVGSKSVAKTKTFLVLADEFLGVMESVFQLSEEAVRQQKPEAMDATLRTYLNATAIAPS